MYDLRATGKFRTEECPYFDVLSFGFADQAQMGTAAIVTSFHEEEKPCRELEK